MLVPTPPSAKCLISLSLTFLLILQPLRPVLGAQQTPAPKLSIVILEGEGAINNIRQRTAREPIVQVEDENHRPVAGALVMFTLPDSGPSGVFANGSKSLMVYTDAQGKAVAQGLQPNKAAGKFKIRVNASHKGQTAETVISQENVLAAAAAAGGISGKLIAIIAIAGGAAAAGAIAATRGGNNTTTQTVVPPTVITAGTPTVGGPP